MKVLLVGLGRMGQFHLQNLLKISQVEKIYAFDIAESAFKIKNEKIEYSTDLEKFVGLDYDFVDVVTPTKFHYLYLEKFVKLNKNIFVEKPITTSFQEVEKLENLMKQVEYTAKIGVGFIERFNPVSKFLKKKIKELGEPRLIEVFRYNPASERIKDVDVATDLMIHDIDLVNYFLEGEINLNGKILQSDISTVLLKFGNVNIMLSANRITQQKIRKIKVYYDDKTLDGDLMLAKINIYHKPSQYLTSKGQDLSISYLIEEKLFMKENQLLEELKEFVDIVNGGEWNLLADFSCGKKSVYLLDKILGKN